MQTAGGCFDSGFDPDVVGTLARAVAGCSGGGVSAYWTFELAFSF